MANVEAIAAFGGRLEALHFGVADYAASCKARTVSIGGLNPDYPGRPVALRAVAHDGRLPRLRPACRSTARSAISPIPTATWPAARRAAALGIEGKWAIHPSQIELANEVFSPPEKEVDARRAGSSRCSRRPRNRARALPRSTAR